MIDRNGLSSLAVRQQEEERKRRQQRIDFALRNEPNTSTSVASNTVTFKRNTTPLCQTHLLRCVRVLLPMKIPLKSLDPILGDANEYRERFKGRIITSRGFRTIR